MFKNWKPENKKVLNHVVCKTLEEPIAKQHSDEYCGVFVDARPRAIGLLEEYASFRAFKSRSRYNYPIFVLINEDYAGDFLNEQLIDEWRITVIPIKNLDCSKNLVAYSDFMIKEMPFYIPPKHTKALFWQADGFLLNHGWENHIEHCYPHFLGAPTRHISSIIFKDNPDISNIGIISMNGGFSFRRIDSLKKLSAKYGKLECYERGREDFQRPPEDLFFSYCTALEFPNEYPKMENAALFSQDPLKSIDDIKNTYGFHSCQY